MLLLIVSSTIHLDRIDPEKEKYRIAAGTFVTSYVFLGTKGLQN